MQPQRVCFSFCFCVYSRRGFARPISTYSRVYAALASTTLPALPCSETYTIPGTGHITFSLEALYQLAQDIAKVCPYDKRLVEQNGVLLLSTSAAHNITNTNPGFLGLRGWEFYPLGLIGQRIQAWKLPLLTVLFLFRRPPYRRLGWSTIVNFLADPWDTTAILMYTLGHTQFRVERL